MSYKIKMGVYIYKRLCDIFPHSGYFFSDWIYQTYNCKVIKTGAPNWSDESLIFPSEEDYFLFLLKLSE